MRDKKGRFQKKEDGINISFILPSIRAIALTLLLLAILLPWIIIGIRSNIPQKIYKFIDNIMSKSANDGEGSKKMSFFTELNNIQLYFK